MIACLLADGASIDLFKRTNSLKGGAGDDILKGGQGQDICVLQANTGLDTIRAFQDGQDKLKALGGLKFGSLTITQQGSNTLISTGSNQLAILTGANISQITAADFV